VPFPPWVTTTTTLLLLLLLLVGNHPRCHRRKMEITTTITRITTTIPTIITITRTEGPAIIIATLNRRRPPRRGLPPLCAVGTIQMTRILLNLVILITVTILEEIAFHQEPVAVEIPLIDHSPRPVMDRRLDHSTGDPIHHPSRAEEEIVVVVVDPVPDGVEGIIIILIIRIIMVVVVVVTVVITTAEEEEEEDQQQHRHHHHPLTHRNDT